MDPEFIKLHGLEILICKYCNHLKTIDNFKSNHSKSKYTVRCIKCRNKAEDFRKTNYIQYFCENCKCHLTSPKKLMSQCIKQHQKTAKHIRNVKGCRDS